MKRERGVNPLSSFLLVINQLTILMKTIELKKLPELVASSDFYISYIRRGKEEIDLTDGSDQMTSQEILAQRVQVGDIIEDNYCHGMYLAV